MISNPTKDLQYQMSLHCLFLPVQYYQFYFLIGKVLCWKPISIQLNMVPN